MEARAITVQTTIRGPARFDMAGQSLPTNLTFKPGGISQGLVTRLHSYGLKRMLDIGLDAKLWKCTIETVDQDAWGYRVIFDNLAGGEFQVCGILTKKGKPFLDHGISLNEI